MKTTKYDIVIRSAEKEDAMKNFEEKSLKERIRNVIFNKGESISDMAQDESDRIQLTRHLNPNKKTSVPFWTIFRVLYRYHDIDANWLVIGEGPMLKKDSIAPRVYTQHNEVHSNHAGGDINVGPDTIVSSKTVERLESIIDEKNNRIRELEQDKAFLIQIIGDKYPHLNIKK